MEPRQIFLVFTTLILFLLPLESLHSQEFEWLGGFDGFLDNREYYSTGNPQTMFGARIRGEAGVSLNTSHRFRFGLNYLQEFGDQRDPGFPDVTLYYQYERKEIDFRFGSFPRAGTLDFPLSLLSDTLLYYRPNIEGAYLRYSGRQGSHDLFIDWTSRQTDDDYEQFIYGISGNFHAGIFYMDYHAVMGHFAGKAVPEPGFHLRDNGGFDLNLGLDLSDILVLDSLSITAGALVSLDRIRGVDEGWQTPAGFAGRVSIFHRWFGADGLYYRGEGHTFLYGDPFYRLSQYGRLDLYWMPFRAGNVNLRINIAFHFAEHQVDFSQQLLLSIWLDGARPFRMAKPSDPGSSFP